MTALLTKRTIIRREELEALVALRLQEADALRSAGCSLAAVYLSGYAVECQLKAAICHTLGWDELRGTFQTHDLELLMLHSGFHSQLQGEPEVAASFIKVQELWSENLRYSDPTIIDEKTAALFYEWVRHPERGIVPWLHQMISTPQ